MEEVSANCTFIFTTNLQKLSGALRSRCLVVDFTASPEEVPSLQLDLKARLNQIMIQEEATCDPAHLDHIVASAFPDVRQILKRLQEECGR
jgi:DNA polymerase III delta prime subunit